MKGAPTILVVAGAALRVADLCRQTRPLAPGRIGKLFAKHMSFDEQVNYLNSHILDIAVGTPDRLGKLLASGSLRTDDLKYIVLDTTWTDAKGYSLGDLPDVAIRRALWLNVLAAPSIRAALRSGSAKLVLF